MRRAGGLQVPQIVVTQERKYQHIPSIKISVDGASSESEKEDEDDEATTTRTRLRRPLRPDYLRWWRWVIKVKSTKQTAYWWCLSSRFQLPTLMMFNLPLTILIRVANNWIIPLSCKKISGIRSLLVYRRSPAAQRSHSEINLLSISAHLWLFERLQLIYFKTRNAAPSGDSAEEPKVGEIFIETESEPTSSHKSIRIRYSDALLFSAASRCRT